MLSFFRGETITILRKQFAEENEFGNATITFTEISSEAIISFQNSSTIFTPEEAAFSTEVKLIFDAGTVIEDEDIFIVRGTQWEKNGISWEPGQNMIIGSNAFLPAPVIVKIKQVMGNVGQNE